MDADPLKWDGFLNAVPKKKVSHSRKRMRAANKGLKDRVGEWSFRKTSGRVCASQE